MSGKIKTYIADSNVLISEGLRNVLSDDDQIEVVGTAENGADLVNQLISSSAQVAVIDYSSKGFEPADVLRVLKIRPDLHVVGIVNECDPKIVQELISAGLKGHLMNDCDREEVLDSVKSCATGGKFFCGQVLDRLNEAAGEETDHGCEAVNISERELEILQLIAEGLTTKQIASQLHISFHTVMTHRKNMMSKLGLNNTAGLIIYAVKENLISPNKFLFSND